MRWTTSTTEPADWLCPNRCRRHRTRAKLNIDLHGLHLREALRRTDAFLRNREQARGTVAVRVVTGHGAGILKKAIGDLLTTYPSVARVTTALQGDAVRVVVLRPPLRRA